MPRGSWIAVALACCVGSGSAAEFFVATDGDDTTGDGSSEAPWATITRAVDLVPSGAIVTVRPGTYDGRTRLRRTFDETVLVRSEIPYAARLRHDDGAALVAFTARNVTIQGFDIAHAPGNTGALVIQVQDLLGDVAGSDDGTDPVVSDITFRDNIIRGSTNNDLLKINNGAERITVEGNLFYDQAGSDEHMDVNSVVDVVIQDNVFFNTIDRGTSSFVVVKDSGPGDTVVGARDITIRRNVFLNWQGSDGHSFVRFGEDSTANFEARDLLVENNLMIGNSGDLMRSALTVQGSRDLVFRNNTVVGDLPSRSFAARLIALGPNPANENLAFYNNVFADPTGTMGAEGFNGVDLFDAPLGQTASATLDRNLYWNGGDGIPTDDGQAVRFDDDQRAIVDDPEYPSQAGLIPPTWNGVQFADGSTSIREVFETLVLRYGVPGSNVGEDAADPANAPADDILGRRRGSAPDLGAFERLPRTGSEELVFGDGFEGN